MIMMTLYINACLIADPTSCRDFKYTSVMVDENDTSCAIGMNGQLAGVEWQEMHPGYRFRGWICAKQTQPDIEL